MAVATVTKAIESTLGNVISSELTEALKKKEMNVDVLFSHEKCHAQLALFIHLGAGPRLSSRISSTIVNLVNQGRGIPIRNVVSAIGRGVPYNEDLVELQILKREKEDVILDFGKLYRKVESPLAYINLTVKFPEPFIRGLVHTHVSQNWKILDGKKVFFMEVMINHPKLWRDFFPSFSVRDVLFTGEIEIAGLWGEIFPRQFWRHLKDACRYVLPGITQSQRLRIEQNLKGYSKSSPYAFLTAVHQSMWEFAENVIPTRFPRFIWVEPEDFELIGVSASFPKITVEGQQMVFPMFPNVVDVKIRTSISADTQFRKGRVVVDISQLRKMVSRQLRQIRGQGPFWERHLRKVGRKLE